MSLTFAFEILRTTRQNVVELLADFSPEQLNAIPPGFNNNLIWNAGHIIATQQLLTYGLSRSSMRVEQGLIERYRKGTRPEDAVGEAAVDAIQELLERTAKQLEADYESDYFGDFKTYTTSYGITLESLEEAIAFNNVHEAMHFGTMLALRKLT